VTVVVRVTRPGTAVDVAYVTSQMLDENGDNNQAQATSEVGGSGGAAPGGGRFGPLGGGPAPAGPVGPARPARPTSDGYTF
jgi:hypothetical protein